MKISFELDTNTLSRDELDFLRKVVFHDESLAIGSLGKEGKTLVGITSIVTVSNDESTTEEYEPDDEGGVITGTYPENHFNAGYTGTFHNEPVHISNFGDHKITVIEPGETATVSFPVVPPPPSTVSNFVKDFVDAPPPVSVSPPPPPQESQSISTGANEGKIAMLTALAGGERVSLIPSDDLDSDGTPWDATIHSESRAKNVDGTWRKRRVNKNVEVKAAIAGLESITPNSVPAPPTRKMIRTFVRIDGGQNLISAPEGATDEELSAITGKPTMREDRYQAVTAAPIVPAAPAAPVVPPPPPAAPPVVKTAAPGAPAGTWPELMERVTKYFGAQKITSVDLAEICKTFNIGSVQECFTQPHLIPLVSSAIDAKAATK